MNEKLLGLEWSPKQIAAAFNIDGAITKHHHNLNDAKKSFRAMYQFSGNETGIAWLRVTAFARHIRFKIAPHDNNPKKQDCLFVHCARTGSVTWVEGDLKFARIAANALVCLNSGMDIAELERFADFAISHHQRVEWILDYDTRLKSLRQAADTTRLEF